MPAAQPVSAPSSSSRSSGERPSSSISSTPSGRQSPGRPAGTPRRRAPCSPHRRRHAFGQLGLADALDRGPVLGHALGEDGDDLLMGAVVGCAVGGLGGGGGLGVHGSLESGADPLQYHRAGIARRCWAGPPAPIGSRCRAQRSSRDRRGGIGLPARASPPVAEALLGRGGQVARHRPAGQRPGHVGQLAVAGQRAAAEAGQLLGSFVALTGRERAEQPLHGQRLRVRRRGLGALPGPQMDEQPRDLDLHRAHLAARAAQRRRVGQ